MSNGQHRLTRTGRVTRLGVVIGVVLTVLPLRPPAALAEGDLQIAAEAVYTIDPDAGHLQISVHYTLTNRKPNSGGYRYYYNTFALVLPDNAVEVTARGPNGALYFSDQVEDLGDGSEGRVVTVSTGSFFYNQSRDFTLSFALPSGPPRSDDTTRINLAYTSFAAFAWGDPGLSDVEVRVPGDFVVDSYGSEVRQRRLDGEIIFTGTAIDDPDEWYIIITGRRDDHLVSQTVEVGGLLVEILSWPGDEDWGDRVAAVLERGVPELRVLVGLDYEHLPSLRVIESIDPALRGYAGWYIASENLIEMSEHLDDHVILHELSHLWFNRDLFVERWINEGLADTYADRAVDEIDGDTDPVYGTATQPVSSLESAVRLNQWRTPTISPAVDEAVAARESYGYNASYWVMRALLRDVGEEGMTRVLEAALANVTAYAGEGDPETVSEADDWRRFLDLLAQLGGSEDAERLFRDHVIADAQKVLLNDRAAARERYFAHVDTAADWATPWSIRGPMSEWKFADATLAIDTGDSLLVVRGDLRGVAETLGLSLPPSLEAGYEVAGDQAALESALQLGQAQLDSLTTVEMARNAVDAPRGFFTKIGLIGENPEVEWTEASDRFEADDREGAVVEANDVMTLIAGASDVGQMRVVWASSAFGGLVLAGGGTWFLIRRRRRPAVPAESGDFGDGMELIGEPAVEPGGSPRGEIDS